MALPTVPEAVLFRVLLTINVIFIVIGSGMLAFGVYQHSQSPELAQELEDAHADGTLSIANGLSDVAVGVCGVIGAVKKKRIILLAYTIVVAAVLHINIALMIGYPIATFESISDSRLTLKRNVLTLYGNRTARQGEDFTAQVNMAQRKDMCCGFTGIEGENLFLATEWFKRINFNPLTNQTVQGDKQTLPESCCIKVDSDCTKTKDVKDARVKKFVFEKDCFDIIESEVTKKFWITMSQMIAVSVMQLSLLALSALTLYQGSTM